MVNKRKCQRKKRYKHLTIDDRAVISAMKSQGRSQREIANHLKINPSTISRELKRNAPPVHAGYYLAHKAQDRYEERFSTRHQRMLLKNDLIRSYVESHLKGGWSPEQISGRLHIDHPGQTVSYEAIYQFIYAEKPEYVSLLAHAHRKRKYRGQGKRHKTSHIPDRVPLSKRPEIINKRQRIGDWEIDTMVSRESISALVTMTERKMRILLVEKVDSNTADEVSKAIKERLKLLPKELLKSITYDNGHENVLHMDVNKKLGTKSYFCAPYHSWEKGLIENMNGLVRRYLPKGTDFSNISKRQIQHIENEINTRPRKCLGFKTPLEVLKRRVALAS